MATQTTVTFKKPLTKLIGKSFRLIDFHIYDEKTSQQNNSSSDDDSIEKKSNIAKKDEDVFVIQMFGLNEKGETCCIYINDYKPFFFVKVGDDWSQRNVNGLLSEMKKNIGKYYENSILDAQLIESHKLYGFSGGKKYKFVKFTFKNTTAMNKIKNLWYEYEEGRGRRMKNYIYPPKTGISLELYESNIPPILRYFHIHNISPSGWVYVPTNKVFSPEIKTTTCTYEYVCMSSQLKPLNQKEACVPYKICSFDIEASSSHGDFPIPKKTYKRLATNMVDAFDKQSKYQDIDDNRAKILLQKIILTAFEFDKFDGIDIVYPKQKPTKEYIKQITKLFLETPVQNARKITKDNEDKQELLTIDSIFQQISDFHNEHADSGGFAGDDEDNENTNVTDETPKFYLNKKPKAIKIEKTSTVINVLLNEDYSREEKIQITNEILTILFPTLEGDKVTFIGSTFMKYGEPEPYLNHCFVVGGCEKVENAIIESVDNEKDMLLEWSKLIQKENPDIIIGYNIFGFDYEFLFRRAEENHCERDFLKLSRKIGDICANENKKNGISTGGLSIENTKIQLASGEYDLRYPKIIGRLQIDIYTYFRRDFNLSSYKLDDVASQFISDDVRKIEHSIHPEFGAVTELYSQNLTGLHKDDYIHIELSSFTSDYYKEGKKFKVKDIIKDKEVTETIKGKEVTNKYNVILIEGHEIIDQQKSVKWGMTKDDVTPQDIFRLANGTDADRATVAKYCIQDCNLVHHLMNKIDVITGYIEMSRICSVPINFLIFRGQGIKLTSYVAKKCREKNTLMPDLEKYGSNEGYEGAIVLPPKCSMYMDNPVACVDYSSLYPSSMISQNLSHDSKVWTKEYNLRDELIRETGEKDASGNYIYDNLPDYQYIDLEFDTFKYIRKTPTSSAEKVKSGKMVCRWAQFPDNKKGIMPSILEELLKARSDTRKLIKTEKDPFMQNILDKRQLGYKVTANSLYGQCGAKTSTFYEKDVAASTTATGRMMIIYAKRIIEEVYGNLEYNSECRGPVLTKAEYVYGDSVANYTPVYIKVDNEVHIVTIQELAIKYGNDKWVPCLEEGKQEKEVCELHNVETWTEKGWTKLYRVIRHMLAPHKKMVRILTHTGLVDVTDDHSLIRADGTEISPNNLQLGERLLHNTMPMLCEEAKKIISNGVLSNKYNETYYNSNSMLEAAIIANKLNYDGFNTYIDNYSIQDNSNINFTYCVKTNIDYNPTITDKLINKTEINYEGYVYDLTTENHHFAAGIGNMIVHNTDSVFFTFNLQDPKTGEKIRGKEALEITIEIAQDAAHLCTQWLKPPMELSYEKTLMPFILLSKKRYVGMLYETDPNKGKMKYMGLSLKRRDSCDYLKDTYGGILTILMKEHNIQKSIEFLNESLENLIQGKVSMDKLTITKALRSDYKNPNQIAHKVLADRIAERDPGNKPKPGDRMKFVYFVNNNKKALQGEKIETPEYILENNLKIDYTFYITNQLMKPLQQLFGLALQEIWDYQGKYGAIKQYKKDISIMENEFPDLEIFMKKREKYCSAKIKALLFDKFLTKIFNDKHNIREITSFFNKM